MSQHSKIRIVSLIVATLGPMIPFHAEAVPAAPRLHTLMQPDGEQIGARQWGDEHGHGFETSTGRAIIKDPLTRQWTYAVLGWNGALASSGVRVSKGVYRSKVEGGFAPHLRPTPDVAFKSFAASVSGAPARFQTQAEATSLIVPSTSTANIPVLLANFGNTSTTNIPQDFNTLLFGAGNWSMSDYYNEVSYGKFSVGPGPSGVGGWYRASGSHDYYGANSGGSDAWPGDLVYEAVAAADAAGYNFAAYDRDGDCYVDVVAIVHQGTGEEASGVAADIWSHRWNLSSAQYWGRSHYGVYTTRSVCSAGGMMMVNDYIIQPERLWSGMSTMGVFAHEFGHSLGLPDLYDTDGSSQGDGNWSLMAAGAWGQASVPGDRPTHMDPWSKYKLGWVAPTPVVGTLANESIDAANGTADVYQIRSGSPTAGGEYFLVENRQRAGFDAGLPGAGLLIWHIDEAKTTSGNTDNSGECYPGGPSCASQHYHVAVIEADNLWNLEKNNNRGDAGDPFPGTAGKVAFSATSTPGSNLYSGAASSVLVSDISAPASTMTATLSSSGGTKSDFLVTAVTLSPATPAANGSFTASVTVKNQGAALADGGSLTVWANQPTARNCGAVGDTSVSVGTLAAGASTILSVTGLNPGAAGAKTLRAFVDSGCANAETNETNNQFTKAYSTGQSDFVVAAVTTTPATPAANSSFTASVTVKNQGTSPGDGGSLMVWANQSAVQACGATGDHTATVGVLAAGASTTLTFKGLLAGPVGARSLRAFVDSGCETAESNEANNQLSKVYATSLPDFVVTAVTLNPTLPTPNGTFTATVTVKNQGAASGDGGSLAIWANQPSAQGCAGSGEQTAAIGNLDAGISKTFTFSGLAAGSVGAKTLRAAVDSACASAETNDGNNEYAKAYTTSLSDFVVTAIAISPTVPAVNGNLRVSVTVKNQGATTDNGGTLMVWANQSATPVCGAAGNKSVSVGTLAAGASATYTFSGLSVGVSGSKTLRAFVDSACSTVESTETNNQRTLAYQVGGQPELVVTRVALDPSNPAAGDVFSAIVTVTNQGTTTSSAGWLDVWSDQPSVQACYAESDAYVALGALAPGASATYTVGNLSAGIAGTQMLRAFVDSYCQTTESNEGNNQYTLTYTIPDSAAPAPTVRSGRHGAAPWKHSGQSAIVKPWW